MLRAEHPQKGGGVSVGMCLKPYEYTMVGTVI